MSRLVDFITGRSKAYQQIFGDGKRGASRVVLQDLAKYCRAQETCFSPDARIHAVMEGRREVWLRIANHLNLSSQELLDVYAPGQPTDLEIE